VPARNGGKAPLVTIVALALGVGIAIVVFIVGVYLRAPRATRVHVGESAPDFRLPTIGPADRPSPPTQLALLRGGPVVLIFLDTRWEGSGAYMRYLERMHRRYLHRGLRTLAVSLDSDVAAVAAFIERNTLTFPILSDPGGKAIAAGWGTPRDPEAYLIDPGGRVLRVFTSRLDWSDPTFKETLERYLERAQPGT
jgi:peroxiredoxin